MYKKERELKPTIFTGNIFILHSFDVGDDIDLEKIKTAHVLAQRPIPLSKYFKNYHIPLAVELPPHHASPFLASAKIQNFGVVTLRYQVPFSMTLEELRSRIREIDDQYREQSVADVDVIFQAIKPFVTQPKFFHLRNAYVLIQVNTLGENIDFVKFKSDYGNDVASILRFETETLSDYQRNEILDDAIGYYSGDLVIIDTDAAFLYDDEYEDKLDIFEFANVQFLELQYFDRVLDKRLNIFYEGKFKESSWQIYLPLIGTAAYQPLSELERLKVDISVITDRLENSVKLAGDAYYSEIYSLLFQKLDLKSWRDSLHTKLAIIHDIGSVHQNRIEGSRQDFFSIVIIFLILIEVVLAFMK